MLSKNVCSFLPLCLLAACGAPESKYSEAAAPAPAAEASASTDATYGAYNANAALNSPSRKMIRTADLSCRVNDVFAASTKLEDLVKASGGIVQESKMQNQSTDTRTVYYTSDSLKKIEVYTTTAHLVLRVPVAALDTVLKTIPAISTFVDSRTLSQDDVTLRYLGNSLKNEASTGSKDPMALAHKSSEAIEAAEYLAGSKERNIDRRIENLQLLEEVNFATINVDLIQPERVNTSIVINAGHFTEPSYTTQIGLALSKGWFLIKTLFVALITIWPVLLMAGLAFVIYRRFRRPLAIRS